MKINHDKVKNYNQLLIAIAATAGLLFFLVTGLFVLYDAFLYNPYHTPTGIIAQEETDQLLKDSLRKQVITFQHVNLLDSLNQIFILPVTQANLDDEESVNDLLGLTNTYNPRRNKKYKKNYDGTFNNLVIFDARSNESDIIFKTRISINNYRSHEIKNKNYLLITGTDVDSNKDKYINSKDLQEIFIYDLSLQELFKLELKESYSTLRIISPVGSNELFGRFGLDRNKNGSFNVKEEPMIFYRIDVENKKLISILDENQINTLQELLEGK